jgi:uncharacterized Zn finger protein
MRFDDWDRFGGYPPQSRPRAAKGGIRASSQRGGFGESWWGRRWVEVLESFDIGARLQRGRSYARKGQVLSIDVAKGMVEARVQGSLPSPYQVTIKVRPLMPAEWKSLATALSRQAIFAAKLLGGEMPQDIEQAFTEARLSLFPEKLKEISTACSCPDWSNPCKHVAAVYYLLGEAFDRDPFLIFRMRGMDRDEFLAMLGESRSIETEVIAEAEPLPAKPEEFWGAKPLPADMSGALSGSSAVALLPRRLGALQFWRGETPMIQALSPMYEEAARRAERLLVGEWPGQAGGSLTPERSGSAVMTRSGRKTIRRATKDEN